MTWWGGGAARCVGGVRQPGDHVCSVRAGEDEREGGASLVGYITSSAGGSGEVSRSYATIKAEI